MNVKQYLKIPFYMQILDDNMKLFIKRGILQVKNSISLKYSSLCSHTQTKKRIIDTFLITSLRI